MEEINPNDVRFFSGQSHNDLAIGIAQNLGFLWSQPISPVSRTITCISSSVPVSAAGQSTLFSL